MLHYRVSWPLHLVFTPAVLDSYNQLFGFLLRVKKTQRQLHHLWTFQMVNKQKRYSIIDDDIVFFCQVGDGCIRKM